MEQNRCIFCMSEMDREHKRCPVCGKGAWEYQWNSRWLRPYTRLNDRYIVGIVLGEGASGITYLAYDIQDKLSVAIKEYFPDEKVRRDQKTQNVLGCGERAAEEFQKGIKGYEKEALCLDGKKNISGIVEEWDYFTENGTGYIVMEYLSGGSLKEYLNKVHQIQPAQAAEMLIPVMRAVLSLHSEGIIHCDISPDNLLFDQKQNLKLIDLGASRRKEERKEYKELKEGYASPELYQEEGKTGPWTDLYALCAVWYEMVTGKKVPPAPERIKEDTLKLPSEYVKIQPELEQAFMQGLAVDVQRRYFSIENLMGRITMPEGDIKHLSDAVRNEWGGLWIKLTTQVERKGKSGSGYIRGLSAQRIKRVCLGVLSGVLIMTGVVWLYCRICPEQVLAYQAAKDKKEAKELTGYEKEDTESPEYEDDLAFIKKNAASISDRYEEFTIYQLSQTTAREWGKLSNVYRLNKFYLKTDTMKRALELWNHRGKADSESKSFEGRVTVSKTGKKQMTIDLTLKEKYVYEKISIVIQSDCNDQRISEIRAEGTREELSSFITYILPIVSPESYLTADEMEELFHYSEEDDTGSVNLRLNAKCRMDIMKYETKVNGATKYSVTVTPL